MENNYVAIMAGGIGSRFWPGSRIARPKQFLDILGVGRTLIQLTYDRARKLCPKENVFVVTNKMYKDLVKQQLPDLTDNQILCEPSRNNTAPSVAYTALKLHQLNPNANFVIASSDHVILNDEKFTEDLRTALTFAAQNDALLTLGIQPTHPNTGYGYIQYQPTGGGSVHRVVQFTEKPNLETAKKFFESGNYLWNAGIFIWSTKAILKAFQRYAPEIYGCLAASGDEQNIYNTPSEGAFIDEFYPQTPNISIDYAIMEKADNVFTIPANFGWSDLGTWASLYQELEKDDNDNVTNSELIFAKQTKGSVILLPKGKLLVIKGLEDFIIVDDGDVLLIYPKSDEQEIKKVVGEIESKIGTNFL